MKYILDTKEIKDGFLVYDNYNNKDEKKKVLECIKNKAMLKYLCSSSTQLPKSSPGNLSLNNLRKVCP